MFPSRLVSVLGGGAGLQNNYSLEFDGTNDYVNCGDVFDIDLSGTNNYTVSAWVKIASGDSGLICSKRDGSNDGFEIGISSGYVSWYLNDGSTAIADTADGTTVDDSVWHHIALVFKSGDKAYRYVDGVSTGTNDSVSSINDCSNSDNFFIGSRDKTSPDNFITGSLDEVSIWDTALSAGDISTLYSAKGTANLNDDGNSANLQGWWRMGDGVLDSHPLIADQVNPTLGTDVAVNGDLSSNPFAHATDYSGGWSDTSIGSSESTWSSGNQTISTIGDGSGTNRGNATMRITAVSGKVYKISYTNSTTPVNSNLRVGTVNSWSSSDVANISPSSNEVHYFRSTVSAYLYITFSVYDANIWTFGNVKIEPVNGNAGLMTNMASDDIVKDTP